MKHHQPLLLAPLLLLAATALPGAGSAWAATDEADGDRMESKRLLFLLEYIGVDYGAAVQDAAIANAFEYQEMTDFSRVLVEQFDTLRRDGASKRVLDELLRLQELIRNVRPWSEILALTDELTTTLFEELEIDSRPAETPDIARGERLYLDNCAACHGPSGAGDGFAAPWQDPPATSFHDARMDILSPHHIYGAINFGIDGTAMPSYLDALPSQQLWDIAFHVLALRSDADAGRVTPEETADDSATRLAVQLQDAFTRVADEVLPSVVSVTSFVRHEGQATTNEDESWTIAGDEARLYPGFRRLRSGSGFFVTEDGYLLSCHHIVTRPDGETAEVIDVELPNGRHVLSRLVGAEPTINLAVLKLEIVSELRPPKVRPAAIGDSDAVRVGHWSIAVGDPWGPSRTYAVGTLAAQPQRQCYQEQLTGTLMQSALSIHPESYGGPLVNIHGNVVGINVPPPGETGLDAGLAARSSEFALPINLAMNIYEALKVSETKQSPWLGFSVLELAAAHRQQDGSREKAALPRTGVYIDDVFDPSPASRAGIRVGDSLVSLDGNRLFSVLDFQKWLYLSGVGRTVKLEIFREQKTLEKNVKIEERPKSVTTR